MENQKIFENHETALKYCSTVPWKVSVCNVGENCWCRTVVLEQPVYYVHRIKDLGESRIEQIDSIILDGSVDKITAEHIVKVHNKSIEKT